MKHSILIGLLLLILHSIDGQAADKYVRKGASGNGTSWSNAYGDLNEVSWTGMSGYTLWIAAGNYTGTLTTINTPNVTIKRATVSSHGSSTGWSDSYDGQVTVDPSAEFLAIGVDADGFIIDGVSNNPWKFRVVGISGWGGMLQNYGADNVTIRNIEFDGNNENPSQENGPEDGLRFFGGAANNIIEHCYIHNYAQWETGDEHMDGVQAPSATNITFRYNIFANNGMHLFLGDCEWENQYVNGINIHHNLFYNTANSGYASYNTIVLKGTNQGGSYPTKIENNTFAVRSSEFPLPDYRNAIGLSTECNNMSNSNIRNNIFFKSTPGAVTYLSHSYNVYYGVTAPPETGRITGDPLFIDYANHNYALQSGSPARDAGTNLGYGEDIIGTAVPQNGSPDMGAYEFDIGGGRSPARPTNLRIIK